MNNSMKNEKSSMNATPYYSEDGTKIAILISPRYTVGWSTYNRPELAYDNRVIKWWINHHDNKYCHKLLETGLQCKPSYEYIEFRNILQKWGYEYVNLDSYPDIELQWINSNQQWKIEVNDGYEYLTFINE